MNHLTLERIFACLQVRCQPGIEAAEAVDTLLVLLLSKLGYTQQLTELLEQPNKVLLDVAASELSRRSQRHALALLHAHGAHVRSALKIWQVHSYQCRPLRLAAQPRLPYVVTAAATECSSLKA